VPERQFWQHTSLRRLSAPVKQRVGVRHASTTIVTTAIIRTSRCHSSGGLSASYFEKRTQSPTLAWETYNRGREPDTALLLNILHQILEFFDIVYIVIDVLDESQPRNNLISLLEVLVTNPRFGKIQLLSTSREYSDIERNMSRFSQPLSMSNPSIEADIKVYVAAKIKAEAKFLRWPSNLRTNVEETLSTGAKGMFRWAVCQLDILRRLNHHSKIRDALKSLPETLDETYERIFSYISDEEKEIVRHTLHWVCFHDFLWKATCRSQLGS
jgi:hypothetical protein